MGNDPSARDRLWRTPDQPDDAMWASVRRRDEQLEALLKTPHLDPGKLARMLAVIADDDAWTDDTDDTNEEANA